MLFFFLTDINSFPQPLSQDTSEGLEEKALVAGEVEEPLALPSVLRERRFIHDRGVNVSLVEYLDTGTWYLSIYNDGIGMNEVGDARVGLLLQGTMSLFFSASMKLI